MQWTTMLAGLALLNGLIVVHELGHLVAARRAGLSVPEFSVGFGPRLFGVRLGDLQLSWRLFPLGGYVLIPALAPDDEGAPASIRARTMALLAGPIANLLLAIAALGPVRTATLLVAMVKVIGAGGVEPAGPVAISQAAGQAAARGWQVLVQFSGFLSLNLAIFNLLPVPGLDGGRLLGLLIEKLNGGRRPRWEPAVQAVGLLLLLGAGLWVTGREILRLVL